ncbi:MAG: hypothetical protein Q9159_002244 [Coniocarpon cinnabarinum]
MAHFLAGAARNITADADVTAGFAGFYTAFTQPSLDRLLELYPESDFQSKVKPDGVATAQFYRASCIFRDVVAICPALFFTAAMSSHDQRNVTLNELNATTLDRPWALNGIADADVSHYSDIPYVFNEEVARGDNSLPQRLLSAQVAGSWSALAAEGDPQAPGHPSGDTLPSPWPLAYAGSAPAVVNGKPKAFTACVIGGASPGAATGEEMFTSRASRCTGSATKACADAASSHPSLRDEELFERCAFINGLAGEFGV